MGILDILGYLGLAAAAAAFVAQILFMRKYKGMHYNWYTFRRHGLNMGLSKQEIAMLRDVAYDNRLRNFHSIYTSARILDNSIIKTVKNIKKLDISDKEKHTRIENLFLLRNKLDHIFAGQRQPIDSSIELKQNQPLRLSFEKIGEYQSQVLDVNEKYIAVAMPLESVSTEAFSWKRKKLQVFFSKRDDAEYSFASRVLEQASNEETGILYIAHSKKLHRTQKRTFRRNDVNIAVSIYPIGLRQQGNSRKLTVLSKTPVAGMITNLSASGMAIRTSSPVKEKALLKLDFILDEEEPETVIGRVLGFSVIPETSERQLHIKIERMKKKTRNSIFEYIYQEKLFGKPKAEKVISPKQTIMVDPAKRNQEEANPRSGNNQESPAGDS